MFENLKRSLLYETVNVEVIVPQIETDGESKVAHGRVVTIYGDVRKDSCWSINFTDGDRNVFFVAMYPGKKQFAMGVPCKGKLDPHVSGDFMRLFITQKYDDSEETECFDEEMLKDMKVAYWSLPRVLEFSRFGDNRRI